MSPTPLLTPRPSDHGGRHSPRDGFARQVHDALRHLYDPVYLQTHALVGFIKSEGRTSALSVGAMLRRQLVDGIEALRPSADGATDPHAWRSYRLLTLRYVEAISIPAIQAQLALSKSEYFRDQRAALDALVSLLGERWGLAEPGHTPSFFGSTDAGEGAAPLPALRTVDRGAELPTPLTSFVGRERELDEVQRLLGEARLLTLIGAGGIGKSRLALAAAAGIQETYRDGVRLVALAAQADPELVSLAIAGALDVSEQPNRPILATLTAALRERQLLLILDNCEHLVDACAHTAETLLQGCPRLQILATSRQPLGMAGEVVWTVPPLSGPEPGELPSVEVLARAETVRLFVDRARAGRPDFALTERKAPVIAELCRRLDGIPLAIELAAARVRVLTVEQIAARLDDRFRLLTGGSRSALPRQQTLQATLDWSYALLSQPERTLFNRLSVFAGGWTLDAAEAVATGEWIETAAVLDLLTQLVDKSLVLVEVSTSDDQPEVRYSMLETLREYSRDRLAESGELDGVRGRQRDWARSLVEQSYREGMSARQVAWRVRLRSEHANLRAVLAWCREHDAAAGLQIASKMSDFWEVGHLAEGLEWFQSLLARSPDATVVRARALARAGYHALQQSDLTTAKALSQESLSLAEELGDTWSIGMAVHQLGHLAGMQDGDEAKEWDLLQKSVTLMGQAGDAVDLFMTRQCLGQLALRRADYTLAESLFQQNLAAARARDAIVSTVGPLRQLGELAQMRGEMERARQFYDDSLASARKCGARVNLAAVLDRLGELARLDGDFDQAREYLQESLAVRRQLGNEPQTGWGLYSLALLAQWQGAFDRAQELL